MAATVATYFPGRVMEHPKSKSTQPRSARRWATLYVYCLYITHVVGIVSLSGSLNNVNEGSSVVVEGAITGKDKRQLHCGGGGGSRVGK